MATMMGKKMDDDMREAKREEIFAETFARSQRFGANGLFTQPAPLAIGETNFFPEKKARRNQEGDVIIGPKNFVTNPVKKGKIDSALLGGVSSYNAVGEPFQQAALSMMRTQEKDGHLRAGHDFAFKPAKVVKEKVIAAYPHETDRVEIQKNFKDDEGNVVTGPRNFLTNPPKNGKVGTNTSFGGQIPYMPDEYDVAKEIAKDERQYHLSKLQDKPFSQRAKTKGIFNTNKNVIGEDRPLPHRETHQREVTKYDHDKAFKPSHPPRTGQIHKTINRFPGYMEDPPKEITRKIVAEDADVPKKFKPTHNKKSTPMPSVATNMRNLKASFPSVFRR